MYLERVTSKGNDYLYLRMYDKEIEYGTKKRTLYRFGRAEHAREELSRWKSDVRSLPKVVKDNGGTQDDARYWERQALSYLNQKPRSN